MKVLKNNIQDNNFPRKIICDQCGSELEYDIDDIKHGYLGMAQIICPVCQETIDINDDNLWIKVTKDNIKFPDYFWHSSVVKDGYKCLSKDINDNIKEGIAYLRNNPEEFAWMTSRGAKIVIVFNYSGDREYKIIASEDFYDIDIDYDDEDDIAYKDIEF